MALKARVEAVLNVGLRIPSIMLLEVLYRWDVSSFFQKIQRSSLNNNPLFQYKYIALYLHYVGYILSLVLLTLPRQHLVQLYLYVLTALLLFAGHQLSRDYVRGELDSGYEGPLYLEPLSMNRFTTALIGQVVVCTLCSCVMQTKQIWLFSAHLLPLVARLCLVPLETIVFINRFAMIFTGLEVLYFIASNLLVPYNLAKTAYRELVQVVEVYGLLALGMSLWNQLVLPVLFMCFWLVLFALQIYTYFSTRDQPPSRERLLFLFLTRSDFIYCVNGTYRLLEFLVAVCVVAYGVSETLFGEWTVMGSTIILVHSYYNVWLRAQLGWQSFLLRRDAVHKIHSMPTASALQLQQHNDICSICFQDMKSAVITPCSHFFHAACLKKWLYVQETCPLCHGQLKSQFFFFFFPVNSKFKSRNSFFLQLRLFISQLCVYRSQLNC
uniref:RING finger protein 145 n=1 Tax=Sinocyclocheilus grahami TaxID=75366 RepID=A0A672RMF8_SINGR